MEIKELQQDIKVLVEKINKNHKHSHPELISYMKVVEELGEITEELLRNQVKSRKGERVEKEEMKNELGDEIADCLVALISLANDFDIQLEKHLGKKMSIHKERVRK